MPFFPTIYIYRMSFLSDFFYGMSYPTIALLMVSTMYFTSSSLT